MPPQMKLLDAFQSQCCCSVGSTPRVRISPAAAEDATAVFAGVSASFALP